MVNWEIEFKRWCPALKIMTYFGNAKERKLKRTVIFYNYLNLKNYKINTLEIINNLLQKGME